jgi:hypothetical protein
MSGEGDRKHWAQSTAPPYDGAPPGVRPISLDALNYLGVSDDGDLYWRDTRIMAAKKEIRLSIGQWIVAGLTAFGAVVAAGAASVTAYVDYQTYLGANGK